MAAKKKAEPVLPEKEKVVRCICVPGFVEDDFDGRIYVSAWVLPGLYGMTRAESVIALAGNEETQEKALSRLRERYPDAVVAVPRSDGAYRRVSL